MCVRIKSSTVSTSTGERTFRHRSRNPISFRYIDTRKTVKDSSIVNNQSCLQKMFKGGKPAWHGNHERKGRGTISKKMGGRNPYRSEKKNTNDGDLIFYTTGTLLASFSALPTGGMVWRFRFLCKFLGRKRFCGVAFLSLLNIKGRRNEIKLKTTMRRSRKRYPHTAESVISLFSRWKYTSSISLNDKHISLFFVLILCADG